jgi:hypothetical protein
MTGAFAGAACRLTRDWIGLVAAAAAKVHAP